MEKKLSSSNCRRAAFSLGAKTFWRIPGAFGIARVLGRDYSLRCVVFHHISAKDSPFTHGINVRTSPEEFEMALAFIAANYTPVRLDDILDAGRKLPSRPMLITFDDAYASVADIAAPLCKKYRIPAVFFVNAALLDNQMLAADNLVCYAVRMHGMAALNAAAREAVRPATMELSSLAQVFNVFFPALTLDERRAFIDALKSALRINERQLAQEASLYLSSEQLGALRDFDFEIGNHTYSHVHCRRLSSADYAEEIDRNKAALEAISCTNVRAFSQPYGSSSDLTPNLVGHLRSTGHKAAFLSESVANTNLGQFVFDRINPCAKNEGTLFFEVEVLPRLRSLRNRHLWNRQKSMVHKTVGPGDETCKVEEQRLAL